MRVSRAIVEAVSVSLASSLLIAGHAVADPSIVGFTPDHGPPGTLVKIIGADLASLETVEFGGIQADSFRVVASNHVKATVPAHAMTGPIRLRTASATAVSAKSFVVDVEALEMALDLEAPSPNPARGPVWFRFTLPRAGQVRLGVHDVQGRRLVWVADERLPAGTYERRWDARDADGRAARPGVYLALLRAQDSAVGRLFLVTR